MNSPKTQYHESELNKIVQQIRFYGLRPKRMPVVRCAYDVLVNDKIRVELKVAISPASKTAGNYLAWFFNIHRHGKLKFEEVDFFIFRIPALTSLGFKYGITLIIPASEIKVKTIYMSARSLIVVWSKFVNRWDLLKDAVKAIKK